MKIIGIRENSIAQEIDLRPGDELLSINGEQLNDVIDYQFNIHDEELELEIKRGDEKFIVEFEDGLDEDLGIDLEELTCRSCGNKCMFCFVDQNPNGVRSSLLFKDEDYRMSFLYGNYITLTNTSRKSLQRIAEQRLSPLYISVHATNPEVRSRMLGVRKQDTLLSDLKSLADQRITMHAQIVLCPGWNDGAVLDETINDLAEFFPMVETVAIVPVGLTGHRNGLEQLTSVTPDKAREVIAWEKKKTADLLTKMQSYFIFLADEFFLLAGEEIPPAERYEDFAQIENGVGMVRQLFDEFEEDVKDFPTIVNATTIDIITGKMAASVLEERILPSLNRIDGLQANIRAVKNRFHGGGVSVSGLLVGQDIAHHFADKKCGDLVVLPPNCLNHDNLFLDDWTVERLQAAIGAPVVQVKNGFQEIFQLLS